MRRLVLALVLAALPISALADSLGVPLNQSLIVALPAPAHDVVVGDPTIADVVVSDQRHLVVTGKSGGVTNLVVADAAGRTIFDRQIVVSAASGDRVSVINGPQVLSYACAPTCEQVGAAQGAPSPAASSASGSMEAVGAGPGGVSASPGVP